MVSGLGSRTTAPDWDVERVLVAFTLPHRGHNGVPGAPDDSCMRCNAERAFDRIVAAGVAAEEALRRKKGLDRWCEYVHLPGCKRNSPVQPQACTCGLDTALRAAAVPEENQQTVNLHGTEPILRTDVKR